MRLLIITLIMALIGCGHEGPAAPPPSSATEKLSTAKLMEPSKELSPLIARLQYEARHRPGSSVTADRVLDALDRAGVRIAERHQYLGASMRASYCLGGQTGDDIALAVCEYPTHDAAVAGKTFMDQRFAAMAPAAHREAQNGVVLTIVDPTPGAHQDIVAHAFRVFAALPLH